MQLTDEDLQAIFDQCVDVTGIHNVYHEIVHRFPNLSSVERRDVFLDCVAAMLRKGWLEFWGETQIFQLSEIPNVDGVPRPELAAHTDLEQLIEGGRYWYASPAQKDALRQRLLFDDTLENVSPNGLRVPTPNTPEAVVNLIRAKWPPQIFPQSRYGTVGFDPTWFDKWSFRWSGQEMQGTNSR
jgi:hypothetical protein